jgi:outer membrane protein W
MKNTFKSRIAILCIVGSLFVIPASNSFGEDFVTSVGAGSKALLFTFSGLNTVAANAYQGGLGAKYYILDPLALRASLLFSFADQATPAPAAGGTAGDANSLSWGLNIGAEYHLLKTRVSPYVGATLGFSSTTNSSKLPVATGVTQTTTTNAPPAGFGFNIAALGGVEFFIIKELSLGAEYRLGYTVTAPYDQKATTGNTTVTTKSGGSSSIGIASVGALTLAFYF